MLTRASAIPRRTRDGPPKRVRRASTEAPPSLPGASCRPAETPTVDPAPPPHSVRRVQALRAAPVVHMLRAAHP